MSYAQWTSFAYYNTGDIVGYNAVNYQALQANNNVIPTTLAPNWQLLTSPSSGAVNSLNTLTGNVVLSSDQATFTPNSGTGVLDMTVAFPEGVTELNTLFGAIELTSTSITITPDQTTGTISLEYGGGGVDSLNGLDGKVTLESTTISITPDPTTNTITLEAPESVTTLNTLFGAVTLTSKSLSISPDSADGTIALEYDGGGVASLNDLDGKITLKSTSIGITQDPTTNEITLEAPESVTTLNTLFGAVTLSSPDATFTPNVNDNDISMAITFPTTSYGSWYSSTTQSLNNGAETILTYSANYLTDPNASFSIVGGVYPTNGIIVNQTGIYKVLFSIQVDRTTITGTGEFQAYVKVNNVAVPNTNTQIHVNNNIQSMNTSEFILSLTATNIVNIGCWSNSTGQQALAVPISVTNPVATPSTILNIIRLA